MKEVKQFISSFIGRAGNYVFVATIISKILSFLASWVALQLIPNKKLGAVIFAFQIVLFLIPMGGLGLNQGLIRYGAQQNSIDEKNNLFLYALKKGVLVSLGLIGVLIIVSFFINFELENTRFYLIFLSFAIITHFVFELVKIQFRLHKNNKLFAYSEVTYNSLYVLFVTILSYYFQEFGYAVALLIVPLITAIVFLRKLDINWKVKSKPSIVNFSFWRYGFFASLSNVTTQLLVSIDIILIGILLNNLELVTAFKYVSLIPYSLLFLSQVVMITDFVNLTEKIHFKTYIRDYIKNYLKILSVVSLSCIGFIYVFGKSILALFDTDYSAYFSSLMILTIGISGILTLRGLFGNLLSSIGKAHVNFVITAIALVLNVVSNYYLIPQYGILGAAITTAILMWFTGILSAVVFFSFFKKMETVEN